MAFPVCDGTYSNIFDESDVQFLNGVEQFTKRYAESSKNVACNYCYEPWTPLQNLQRCGGCHLVSYCSRDCQKSDRYCHKYICKEFPVINGKNALFTKGPMKEHLEGLRERAAKLDLAFTNADEIFYNPRYCNTCKETRQDRLIDCVCTNVSYCNKRCSEADKLHKKQCLKYREQLLWSYPNALIFALETLPDYCLSHSHKGLDSLTSLTVHVISSSPLFDSKPWEDFIHQYSNMKHLNIVFIMQGKKVPYNNFNEKLNLRRCNDCETNDRIITYSVQQMQYHMFFSSMEFSEPDVVVVYDCTFEMHELDDEDIHSELSYHNMTYSSDIVLILMASTEDLITQGVKYVNNVRPIVELVSPRTNKAIENFVKDTDFDNAALHGRSYFTCLKRNK